MTSPAISEFVAKARAISFIAACDLLGVPQPGTVKVKPGQKKVSSRAEYQGPCPQCGGTDRFSVNRGKGVWNCRGCGKGGGDGIGLAAHYYFLDLRGAGFLKACSVLLGESIPEGGEQETDEERAAREQRIAEAEARAAQERSETEAAGNAFREVEVRKARGLWLNAVDCLAELPEAEIGRETIRAYLKARTGFLIPSGFFEHARFRVTAGYYHSQDQQGRPRHIYSGPAMVMPFVTPTADGAGQIVGCHQTWIDLSQSGKYRPLLWGVTKAGVEAGRTAPEDGFYRSAPASADIDAGFFEELATKKMRGTKKGGLLPLIGGPELLRWAGGEGIENVLAFAGAEGFRQDTFYFTSGDLGNLAGPRDPSSDFFHPTLTAPDRQGRARRVKVQGPKPKPGQGPDDAMQVASHVVALVLVADGDSEEVMTASAMARAEARLQRPGLTILQIWPPAHMDFSGATSAALNKGE